MESGLPLFEVGLVLLVAALAGALSRRLSLPAVLGYLAVGVAISPFTPGYVVDRGQLAVLADVGVVLLLFEVGIELDLRTLAREPRGIVAGVPLQMAVSVAAGTALLLALGVVEPLGAVTIALATSISSSVVVINISRSRRRPVDADTGRAMVVWAIIQDAVMLVAVAALAAILVPGGAAAVPFALARMAAFGLLAFVVHAAVVPFLLRRVRDQRDIFIAVSISVALATAGIGSVFFGVPVALAAFVAGLSISLRPEAQEARAVLLPLRDTFAILFFVSVGTLLDPAALPASWLVVLAALALVAFRGALVALLARTLGIPGRHRQIGVGHANIAEFSFVVLGLGAAAGVVTSAQFSAVLAAAVLSIAISTVAVGLPAVARPA